MGWDGLAAPRSGRCVRGAAFGALRRRPLGTTPTMVLNRLYFDDS
jgi:hypothetical protein